MTLASIITPTFPGREELLLERCLPSVRAQSWPNVEHVIVSDRNPDLAKEMVDRPGVIFVELNETWRDGIRERSTGAFPWYVGSLLALGEYVGFCGDDDELLPDHVERHVTALVETGADFTISPVRFMVGGGDRFIIGDGSFDVGHLDSDGIMCRIHALRVASWRADGDPQNAADAELVGDWVAAGLRGHFIGGGPTAIHHDGWAAG